VNVAGYACWGGPQRAGERVRPERHGRPREQRPKTCRS
jgi:hypothetical protein